LAGSGLPLAGSILQIDRNISAAKYFGSINMMASKHRWIVHYFIIVCKQNLTFSKSLGWFNLAG